MTVAIHAEGLGKLYRRGASVDSGLRHVLERFLRAPLRTLQGPRHETFWALRNVSLQVNQGEVLGLIGRNGSGKTTLLKILSRITRPTEGWAEIRGRVGSLLEVGTGFHPELTGRENAFLSGAILGMSKAEITSKFDEIVAFAELEKFIDTPVKHFSSGMYVRLAFAVAAHLEPEILLVDEVLAVGDINFQKRCLGKMGEVARGGRTVVLVSHQLGQIRRLCNRVIWVEGGAIRRDGGTNEVVGGYEAAMARGERMTNVDHPRPAKARFVKWEIASTPEEPQTLKTLDQVTIAFTLDLPQEVNGAHYGVALRNHDQQVIWAWENQSLNLDSGQHRLCHTFSTLPVRPGLYTWLVALYDGSEMVDFWECVPDMLVATESFQHPQEQWSAVLNLPAIFSVDGTN